MRNKLGQFVKGHKGFGTSEGYRKVSQKMKGKKKPPRSTEHAKKIGDALRGRKLSLGVRRNISNGHKGEKSYLWKGGITPINESIRKSFEYRLWRIAVFERDNWTCIWCGRKRVVGDRVILRADHIKPFADYPELRFAIDNGRTLCDECHKKTNTYGVNKIKK